MHLNPSLNLLNLSVVNAGHKQLRIVRRVMLQSVELTKNRGLLHGQNIRSQHIVIAAENLFLGLERRWKR